MPKAITALPNAILEPSPEFVGLSLAVPVRDRPGPMVRLLQAVAAQSLPTVQFEVLVCDDGSGEAEAAAIESLVMKASAEDDLTVAYLRQARAGAGAARNLGLAHARGELVVFTDSDCLPEPEWLERLVAVFDDPAVGLAGGPAEGRGAATLGGRCVNFLMTTTLGAAGARDPRSALHVKFYPRSYNLAVRRELALAVGGFPAACYGEDIEFSQRVAALGVGVAFVPEAVVVHDERRSPWQTAVQSFKKGFKRVETAGRCGMHNMLYAVPAVLLATLAVWMALFALRSPVAIWAAVPLVTYALAMVGLGVYGAVAMREPAALVALPLYAGLMHAAYGAGYWLAVAGTIARCAGHAAPSPQPSSRGRGSGLTLGGGVVGNAHPTPLGNARPASGAASGGDPMPATLTQARTLTLRPESLQARTLTLRKDGTQARTLTLRGAAAEDVKEE